MHESKSPRGRVRRSMLLLGAVLAASGVLAGCGGGGQASAQGGGGGGGGGGGRGGPGGNQPVPVEVTTIAEAPLTRSVSVSGTVAPIHTVGVNSRLASSVSAILVEEGDRVRRGQVLVRLDDREVAAQLRQAEASAAVAERAFARARELKERRVITEVEFERAEADYLTSAAARDALRARVGYATVTAPVDGVVLEKAVERGDVVGAQERLVTLGDLSTLVVEVAVSELDVPRLAVGDRVQIRIDALPDRRIGGRIRRIFPAADSATRLVPVEVAIDAADAAGVRPGFLARVTFTLGEDERALVAPLAAVTGPAGQQSAFVVRGGRAERRPVRTGTIAEGRIEIVDGLAAGDTVIVTRPTELQDGAAVRTVVRPVLAPDATRDTQRGAARDAQREMQRDTHTQRQEGS